MVVGCGSCCSMRFFVSSGGGGLRYGNGGETHCAACIASRVCSGSG